MGLGSSEEDSGGGGVDGINATNCSGGASSVSCSICLEFVVNDGDRSWAKLQCGHQFHLDCIGSAFNVKGAMECPNCRKIEKGLWLYANDCRSFPELSMDDWTHDEDLYDLRYSEMSVGVHWFPFGQLAIVPSPFEEGEFPSSAYYDQSGHGAFAEYTAASSATHPCPYVAYLGPIHPLSSNSRRNVSDSSNFNNHWNGPSVPNDVQNSYSYPAMDPRYHTSDHHSPFFSTASSRVRGVDQSSVPPVTQRSARSSDVPRPGSYLHPFLVGHSPSAGVGSSITASLFPRYPSRNARGRDRVQPLQAYHQQPQPSNSLAMRTPMFPNTRRSSSNHRGGPQLQPMASSSDSTRGFYFIPGRRTFQEPDNPPSTRFQSWERDHLPSNPATIRSSSFRHGSERTSQYRS